MTLLLGLLAGAGFGALSAFANRLWGTVLACVPITTWFVVFAIVSRDGLQGDETAPLCYGLFGVVIGLLVGQVLDRQRTRHAHSAKPRRDS